MTAAAAGRLARGVLALGVMALLGACGRPEPPLERFALGGPFELIDHHGQAFRLADRRGQALLLFFGFTACPDACPTTLSRLGQLQAALPAPGVEVLFVSVDPKRDNPERLAAYVAGYPFRITGLTGPPEAIRAVVSQYGAHFQEGAGGGVDHSLRVYLIDGDGVVRHLFAPDDAVDGMAGVVRRLL